MPEEQIFRTSTDKRNEYIEDDLRLRGYPVITINSSEISSTSIQPEEKKLFLLLPVSASADILRSAKKIITQNHIVIGGNLPADFLSYCREKDIVCIDYLSLPGIAMLNAVATAEGAVCEAIRSSENNLHHSSALVIGYGKCGEILADKLLALNAFVHISTRNPEAEARALAHGCQLHTEKLWRQYDFIFNTAPAPVIGQEQIDQLKSDCVIIDIASKPGGTDFSYCTKKGITARHCLGIPGIYSPKTSAKLICNGLEPVLRPYL